MTTVLEFHLHLLVRHHIVGVAVARVEQRRKFHALPGSVHRAVGVDFTTLFCIGRIIALVAETKIVFFSLVRHGRYLLRVGDGLPGDDVDVGFLSFLCLRLEFEQRAARHEHQFALHQSVIAPKFRHVDTGGRHFEFDAVFRRAMGGQRRQFFAECQGRFVWRFAHQSSQRLFPDVHVGIDAVSPQSLQRCIHPLEPNEVDFHRLHVLPPDQRAISRTGIEGIALRFQFGRRPIDLYVRLFYICQEIVQSDSRFAVTLLSGFCQLHGLVELLVAQQSTNTRNGFAILGEFFVKLGDFSQKLQLFFSFE